MDHTRKLFLLLGVVILLVAPLPAGAFEGVIHMKMTGGGSPDGMQMHWYFKGNKARMEMSRQQGPAWVSIVDYEKRVMMMPMPGQKAYMEVAMDEAQEGSANSLEQYILERTGKNDRVAGYACEIWLVKDRQRGKLKNEICVAKGFENAAKLWGLDADRSKKEPAWLKEFQKQGAFGLRMIGRKDDGTEEMRMEATSIEKKSLDGSLFAMPAGYSKMEMPRMPFGLGDRDVKRQGQDNLQNFLQEMQEGGADKDADAGDSEDRAREAEEMMKQLGEMMKRRQQGNQ